ncbi:Peptide chain release factor N(5)-glutamine methyltransferase [hydrothermal vent metagenome]|uniref:peptide chain release factor N(5)-glutamine methyltransferase n=1 Tax=hydrothermal vent metagenome TaxID=652676 RepID=A0A3B0TUK8_9ZZZZ
MQATIKFIEEELSGLYPKNEVRSLSGILFKFICGLSFTDLVVQKDEKIPEVKLKQIKQVVKRLKQHEPIQYIIGEAGFYGLELTVNPAVLIPRPETEELVEWVLMSGVNKNARALDIGTGSGCIPIAIKKNAPGLEFEAIDISEKAIEVARGNAKKNGVDVSFMVYDISRWRERQWGEFDIVVSNPPYVRELEKQYMNTNILNFEPHQALFVADTDPLKFYKIISDFAMPNLKKGGALFFEINEAFGQEASEMLARKGFLNVELKKDLSGKDRMIKASK